MIDVTASQEIANDARVKANVVRLAAAQALIGLLAGENRGKRMVKV